MPSVFSTSSSTCSSISAGVYQYQLLKTMQLDSATRDFIGLTIMKKKQGVIPLPTNIHRESPKKPT